MSAKSPIPIHHIQWDWQTSAIRAATQSAHHCGLTMTPLEINRKCHYSCLEKKKEVKSMKRSNFSHSFNSPLLRGQMSKALPRCIMGYLGWTGSGGGGRRAWGECWDSRTWLLQILSEADLRHSLIWSLPVFLTRLWQFSHTEAEMQHRTHTHIQKHTNTS